MKKNDIIELKIIDITESGFGVAKKDGIVFFVKGALAGDVVNAVVTKVLKNVVYAKRVEILCKSEYRVEPICEVADKCGGCQLIDLKYEKQLEIKINNIINIFKNIANIELNINIKNFDNNVNHLIYNKIVSQTNSVNNSIGINEYVGIIPVKNKLNIRNKMQVPFSLRNGEIIYGFYAGRTHYVVEFNKCSIGFLGAEIILDEIKKALKKFNISIYDEKTNKGIFREVMLRKGNISNDVSITYIVNDKNYKNKLKLYKEFDSYVREKIYEKQNNYKATVVDINSNICLNSYNHTYNFQIITSTLNINLNNNNVLFGNDNIILYGNGFIIDYIGNLKYQISPQSFYQVNNELTKELYDLIIDFADFNKDENIIDLFCGIGTISLYISKFVNSVIGIEIIDRAIVDARNNAKLNCIDNVDFICDDVDNINLNIIDKKIDTIIVDPPRKGLSLKNINFIKNIKPKKIIYVSCDPATLARDIDILCHKDDIKYNLIKMVNVDMFPHTMHVETVVLMSRVDR